MTLKQFQKEWGERIDEIIFDLHTRFCPIAPVQGMGQVSIEQEKLRQICNDKKLEVKSYLTSRDKALIEVVLNKIKKISEFEETYCERDELLLKNIIHIFSNEIKKELK